MKTHLQTHENDSEPEIKEDFFRGDYDTDSDGAEFSDLDKINCFIAITV